jgi:acetyl-CoA carboxylase biotin carboxyl carrier protein
VEALHRSKLQFICIETEQLKISVDKGEATVQDAADATAVAVVSSHVGIFHSEVNQPQQSLEVGSFVEAGSTLGFIRTLDERNVVKATVSGKVIEICKGDGEFVEFGQLLFRLLPVTRS